MPIHDYACQDCGKEFEELVRGAEEVRCPECASARLERRMSTFALITVGTGGTGGRSERPAPGSCGTCGDPRGPGACSMN